MTAKEAREQAIKALECSEKHREIMYNDMLNYILDKIKESASSGNYCLIIIYNDETVGVYHKALTVRERLKKLGYNVKWFYKKKEGLRYKEDVFEEDKVVIEW